MRHSDNVTLKSGVSLPLMGIGTATFGGLFTPIHERDASMVVDEAIKLGISYFDTAPHYGKGVSESRLGNALDKYPRDSYVISTKVGRILVPALDADDSDFLDADSSVERIFDFSQSGVERSLKDSLERLGKDHVEIVFIHDPDDYADQAISQAYPALAKMRDQGIIKSIGVGMNQPEIPTRFVKETDIDLVLIAGRYTLLDQSAQKELIPAAISRGVHVIAAGVFNSGILANPVAGAHYDYAPASPHILARAQAIASFLQERDISIERAALQFPLRNPGIKSILVGCRSADEVRKNTEFFDNQIPEAIWQELELLMNKLG